MLTFLNVLYSKSHKKDLNKEVFFPNWNFENITASTNNVS